MTALEEVQQAIKSAGRPGFWGSVQIDYQDGKPVVIRTVATNNLKVRTREEETDRAHDKYNR